MESTQSQINSEKITQASGSNFVSSFFFLPKGKRKALTAIYAYCRLTDDIVDLANTPAEVDAAGAKLDEWRRETVRAFRAQSSHPVLAELSAVVKEYKIPEDYFHQLIDGVRMDLDKKSYKTFDELYPYCYGVASVVGLMCLEIFSYKNPRTKDYAVNLGVAFQLTNILRDIKTDAIRGRVYIPEQDLHRFSFTKEEVLALSNASRIEKGIQFRNLIEYECRAAEHFYKTAKNDLVPEDRKSLLPAELMCSVYHSILDKVERDPFRMLKTKIRLSRPELIFCLCQGWLVNRFKL